MQLLKSLILGAGLLALCNCWPALAAESSWKSYAKKPDTWYNSAEGKKVADNILSWQASEGAWPKNTNTTLQPFTGDTNSIKGTFDNGATTGELRFLARAFQATKDDRYQRAFFRGLDHILKAQYPTGGWPQFYPPGKKYHRHITFNDDAMFRLMEFLRDVAVSTQFDFVGADRRKTVQASFDRGIQCILKCQIMVNGKPTAWCAQHDEVDYRPRPGRTFELASLSGAESVSILHLLMSLERPSPEVIRAIKGGVAWFESAKIIGIRQTKINGDKQISKDPAAPPLWARLYEIETNRPIFADRDGVKKYSLAELGFERRNGYSWYGTWGEHVAADFAKWEKKQAK